MSYVEIRLTQGKVALVDNEDAFIIGLHKWCAMKSGDRFYAVTRGMGKSIYMQRLIMSPPDGMVVDHINGETLDNRRGNLRICTTQQNNWNLSKHKGSRFKGVSFCGKPKAKPYRAVLRKNGKTVYVGYFQTEEMAAAAYDLAAIQHFGPFARLNDMLMIEPGSHTKLPATA